MRTHLGAHISREAGHEYRQPVPVFVQAGLLGKPGLARLSSQTENRVIQILEQRPRLWNKKADEKKALT